jgi:hypothetical protein
LFFGVLLRLSGEFGGHHGYHPAPIEGPSTIRVLRAIRFVRTCADFYGFVPRLFHNRLVRANPHSLLQGTKHINKTQLQVKEKIGLPTKPFCALTVRREMLRVEQFPFSWLTSPTECSTWNIPSAK